MFVRSHICVMRASGWIADKSRMMGVTATPREIVLSCIIMVHGLQRTAASPMAGTTEKSKQGTHLLIRVSPIWQDPALVHFSVDCTRLSRSQHSAIGSNGDVISNTLQEDMSWRGMDVQLREVRGEFQTRQRQDAPETNYRVDGPTT